MPREVRGLLDYQKGDLDYSAARPMRIITFLIDSSFRAARPVSIELPGPKHAKFYCSVKNDLGTISPVQFCAESTCRELAHNEVSVLHP